MAKNKTRVLTHPLPLVQRTGINKSVVFARWQQRAAIRLGIAMHLILSSYSAGILTAYNSTDMQTEHTFCMHAYHSLVR